MKEKDMVVLNIPMKNKPPEMPKYIKIGQRIIKGDFKTGNELMQLFEDYDSLKLENETASANN